MSKEEGGIPTEEPADLTDLIGNEELKAYHEHLQKQILVVDTIRPWIEDEVMPKIMAIEMTLGPRFSEYKPTILQAAVTPIYHYQREHGNMEEPPAPATDKQKSYLRTLAEAARQRFYAFTSQREDIDSTGQIAEIIDRLTLDQASQAIGYLKGDFDIDGKGVVRDERR